MIDVPAATPVTTPVALIVATPVLTLLHTPPGVPVGLLRVVVVVGHTVMVPAILPRLGPALTVTTITAPTAHPVV